MRPPFVLLLLTALLLPGCARDRTSPTYAPLVGTAPVTADGLIVTPGTGLRGRVVSVNPNLQFVVLSFPAGQLAAIDQRMILYRRGLKVGEVKVTGPQQDLNIVADIVAGDAEAGDEVRDR